MARQAMRQAIRATRENNGIVRVLDNVVRIRFEGKKPREVNELLLNPGWILSGKTAREDAIVLSHGRE